MTEFVREPDEGPRHVDVAAYVLAALDPQQENQFTAHLATCADCVSNIAWISDLLGSFDPTSTTTHRGDDSAT